MLYLRLTVSDTKSLPGCEVVVPRPVELIYSGHQIVMKAVPQLPGYQNGSYPPVINSPRSGAYYLEARFIDKGVGRLNWRWDSTRPIPWRVLAAL